MAPRRAATSKQRPWWLAEEQPCGFCLQRHAVHAEVRCSGCDRPVCRHCAVVVRARREVFCPDCRDAEAS